MIAHRMIAGSFRPTTIANCFLWVRADLGLTLNAGRVSAWNDQSGNGNNFLQAIGANQPIPATAINGQATIHFDRTRQDKMAASPTITNSTPGDTFLVVKNGDTSQNGLFHFGSAPASQDAYYPFTGGTTWDVYENCGITTRAGALTATSALTNAHAYEVQSSTNAYAVLMDGTSIGTSSACTEGWSATWTLGSNVTVPTAYTGDIAEVLMYERVLNSSERASIMSYLRARYATP